VPEWTIRRPVLDDAESLAALHVDVWQHAYRGLIEQPLLNDLDVDSRIARWQHAVADCTSDGAECLLAAYVEDTPIGIIQVGPAEHGDAPRPTELRSLNVAPSWHGKRVAHELVRRALSDADAYLWVLRGNDRAIAFYRKLGFVFDGTKRYDDVWRCFDLRMQRPAPAGR
jgi:GNAT superfamily N-acetyltransferase